MSPTLFTIFLVLIVFAVAFGLCEWIARGLTSGQGRSLATPDLPDQDCGDAPSPAARLRVAERLEREDRASMESVEG